MDLELNTIHEENVQAPPQLDVTPTVVDGPEAAGLFASPPPVPEGDSQEQRQQQQQQGAEGQQQQQQQGGDGQQPPAEVEFAVPTTPPLSTQADVNNK